MSKKTYSSNSLILMKMVLQWWGSTPRSSVKVAQQGFVLPVALLVVLLLSLVSATIVTRAFNRSEQATSERAQQVMDSAVEKAVDRTRAKLAKLMDTGELADGRLSSSRPSNSQLISLLLDGTPVDGFNAIDCQPGNIQCFQLPDEAPLAVDPPGGLTAGDVATPAWWIDNGNDTYTGYMILVNTLNSSGVGLLGPDEEPNTADDLSDAELAQNLMVRNLPYQAAVPISGCPVAGQAGIPVDPGNNWFGVSTGNRIVKTFQMVAVTVPGDAVTNSDIRAVSALQFQQDRYRDRLSDYAAYFKYDLEIFPGPRFNWNGKMYSESSILIGGGTNFNGFLVSDNDSCFFQPAGRSLISTPFEIIAGSMRDANFNGGGEIHRWVDYDGSPGSFNPPFSETFRSNVDSVGSGIDIGNLAVDPQVLYTQGRSAPRYTVSGTTVNESLFGSQRDPGWSTQALVTGGDDGLPRMSAGSEDVPTPPTVDDPYRADNRCGPYPNYRDNPNNPGSQIPAGCTNIGETIPPDPDYTAADPGTPGDTRTVALDGYWERRARIEGLRLITGQRLNLMKGHPFNPDIPAYTEDNVTLDPLAPAPLPTLRPSRNYLNRNFVGLPTVADDGVFGLPDYNSNTKSTLDQQDINRLNPLVTNFITQAVQATVVYHAAHDFDRPLAVISTLSDATAGSPVANDQVFSPPPSSAFNSFNTPMMRALVNLANLSSDGDDRLSSTHTNPNSTEFRDVWSVSRNEGLGNNRTDQVAGAFPPFQEAATANDSQHVNKAHPNPMVSRHGDFSNLRRALELIDGGTLFSELSIADQSYLYTAASTLGMLAYELTDPGNGYRCDFDGADNDYTTVADNETCLYGLDGLPATGDENTTLQDLANRFMSPTMNAYIPLNPGPDGVVGSNDDPIQLAFANGNSAAISNNSSYLGLGPDATTATHFFYRSLPGMSTCDSTLASPLGPDQRPNTSDDLTVARYFFGCDATPGGSDNVDGITNFGSQPTDNPLELLADNTFLNRLGIYGPDNVPGTNDDLTFVEALGFENYHGNSSVDPDLTDDTIDPSSPLYQFWLREDLQTNPGGVSILGSFLGPDGEYLNFGSDGRPGTSDDLAPNADGGFDIDDPFLVGAGPNGYLGDYDDLALNAIFKNVEPSDIALTPDGGAVASRLQDAIEDISLFNGRERQVVRALTLDINIMRNAAIGGDWLLPSSGIVYAFREDARAEIDVNRPAQSNVRNGVQTADPNYAKLDASGGTNCNSQRPTNNNTACVYLNPFDGTDPPLTLANLAATPPFMGGLSTKPVDFYPDPIRRAHAFRVINGSNVTRSGSTRGLSLISPNSIYIEGDFNRHTEDEFTQTLNSNFTNFYQRGQLNSDFAASDDRWKASEIFADSISITRQFSDANRPSGQPALNLNGVEGRYGHRNSGNPGTSRVNAILISGIVPSRSGQSFGGLHNFPRFLQRWGRLQIRGSFIQLLFSTQATAPFDQDSWPTQADPFPDTRAGSGGNNEPIAYYGAPRREWGFDVGLLYAPISPIAERFEFPSDDRDELLEELPADDPYVQALQCALSGATDYTPPFDCGSLGL